MNATNPCIYGVILASEIRRSDPKDPNSDPIIPVRYVTADTVVNSFDGLFLFERAELEKAIGTGIGTGVNADHDLAALASFGECVGEGSGEDNGDWFVTADHLLYVNNPAFPDAARAASLIERKVLRGVSSEILPTTLTCSICGNTRSYKDEGARCAHVQLPRIGHPGTIGRMYNGKRSYEIGRGLTFGGCAYTRFPADKKAGVMNEAGSFPLDEPTATETPSQLEEGDASMKTNPGEETPATETTTPTVPVVEPETPTPIQAAAGDNAPPPPPPAAEPPAGEPQIQEPVVPDTTPPDVSGMTVEQKAALVDDLVEKLKIADMERKRLGDENWRLKDQVWELKAQVRQNEINAIIDAMKTAGQAFADGEEETLRSQLRDKNDAEFAGYKAAWVTLSRLIPKPAQPAAGARRNPAIPPSNVRPVLNSAAPVNVPDHVALVPTEADFDARMKKAFNVTGITKKPA